MITSTTKNNTNEVIAGEILASEIIHYDFFVSRFGHGLIAGTALGICDITFADAPHAELVYELEQLNSGQQIIHTPGHFATDCRDMFSLHESECELEMHGSEFQVGVWSELCRIPVGQTISYQQLAHRVGRPRAVRAVANAVAKNRIAFLVPCHRVIRADGSIGGYRWGSVRKAEMLDWEQSIAAGTDQVKIS
jgi:AraC family transcriptional regulator, regulatory protein of adaptative response / methylated-DNA-[protein]-cysteine methyltransferase